MLTYIGFFFFIGILSFVDIPNSLSKQSKKIIFWFTVIYCIFFFGGRYHCDNDYPNYMIFYNATPPLWQMTWEKFIQLYIGYQVEPLFFVFSSIFRSFELNGQTIILFYATTTILLSALFIKKTSNFPLISFFLYVTCYFSLPFMQMRFGVAVACCLYAINKLHQENKSSYWKWQIIAILFHMTALIGLLYYCIHKIEITPKRSYFLLFSSFFFVFFPIREIFIWGINLIGMNRYLNYLNEEAIGLGSYLLHIILFSPFFIFQNTFRQNFPQFDMFFKMSILAILLMAITSQLPILNRFSLLFASSSCVSLTYYFILIKKDLLNRILVSIGFFLYAWFKFYPSLQHIDNYKFFLFH